MFRRWNETENEIILFLHDPNDVYPKSIRYYPIDIEDNIKIAIATSADDTWRGILAFHWGKDKEWDKKSAWNWYRQNFPQVSLFETKESFEVSFYEKLLDKPLKVRGILAPARVSRNKNLYLPDELEAAVKELGGREIPVYLEHVDVNNAVGKAKLFWNPEKLQVEFEAEIFDEDVAAKIKNGLIKYVSLGADYEVADMVDGVEVPRGLHFREVSLVAVPGIPEATITAVEKASLTSNKEIENMSTNEEIAKENVSVTINEPNSTISVDFTPNENVSSETVKETVLEKVVPFEATPKADEGREWDADAAEQRIRKWASSDGSGDKDKIDWSKYRKAFTWYDPDNTDNFGGYKLPHHDIVDGKLVAVWRGVAAAMAALRGARGGVDIPENERKGVYNHLAQHYKQFEKEPPTFELLMTKDEEEKKEEVSEKDVEEKLVKEETTEKKEPSLTLQNEKQTMPETQISKEEKEEVVEEGVDPAPKKVDEKAERKKRIFEALKRVKEAIDATAAADALGQLWQPDVTVLPAGLEAGLRKFTEVVEIPRGADRVKFTKITTPTFGALTEGQSPNDATQTVTVIEAVPAERGAKQRVTYTVLESAAPNLVDAVEKSFVKAAVLDEDGVILDALDNETISNLAGVIYGDGSASDADGITSDMTMGPSQIIDALELLQESGRAVAPGDAVLVLHPKQYADLIKNSDVKTALQYGTLDIEGGRVVRLYGVDIVESTEVSSTQNAATPPVTYYKAYLFIKGEAIGLGFSRNLTIETDRKIDERALYLVATHRIAAAIKDAKSVVAIYTA